MAISSYADLQAAAADFIVRSDQTARIPQFIALAEARLNRVLRMRRAEMDVALIATPGSRTISLPAAYSEALAVWLLPSGGSERMALRFVDPAALTTWTDAGQPLGWTIDGATLAFERPCDKAYAITLRCLEKFALSDASPTNALLTDYPDVYLFAALAEAGPFLRDTDFTSTYEQKLDNAIAEINAKEARSRSPQRLATEPGLLGRYSRSSGFNIFSDR